MRFFLEFVSCCGPATERPAVQTTTSSQPLVEDERSLVPPSSRRRHCEKRGRLSTSTPTPEWRPSLGSISEDHIVPPRERGDAQNGKVGPEREVKRRSGGGSAAAAKVHYRNYSDDYKRVAVPTIMPAFSPTPFMF